MDCRHDFDLGDGISVATLNFKFFYYLVIDNPSPNSKKIEIQIGDRNSVVGLQ